MFDKESIYKIYKELRQPNIKKPNNLIQKIGRRSEKIFFQGLHTDSHQVCENMFNIIIHQRNASQNHNETSCYTHQNDYYQKYNK